MKVNLKIVAAFLTASFLFASCAGRSGYVSLTGYAQGGVYVVKYNSETVGGPLALSPEQVKEGVDSILAEIDRTLSGYNKGSLLSRFNAGEAVPDNNMFREIYSFAAGCWKETDGAVDVAAGPLFNIWGFGFTGDSLPSPSKVAQVLEGCGFDRLKDSMEDAVLEDGLIHPSTLLRADAAHSESLPLLNYNAIAQGYSCDKVVEYLTSLCVEDLLVDVGGEIVSRGVNPSGDAWKIGVDTPFDGNDEPGMSLSGVVNMPQRGCGVVTSGNYRKFYIKDGKKYAHTVDPRTGFPVSHNLLSATIIADNGAIADAYATYCMVIGREKAVEFITSSDSVEGYLIYEEDGKMKYWASEGFDVILPQTEEN